MIYLIGLIAIAHFCAVVTPGPDNLFMIQISMSQNREKIVYGALGITAGIIIWCIGTLAGLKFLLIKYPFLQGILLCFGGLYLIWLAFNLFKSSIGSQESLKVKAFNQVMSSNKVFKMGLFTNLSNAKAVFYFSSIFSGLTSNINLYYSIIITLLISIISFIWFFFVGIIFSQPYIKEKYQQNIKYINLFVGILFLFFGLSLFYIVIKALFN